MPAGHYIIIAGDLNGYVSEKVDGNRCFGASDGGDEHFIDFANTDDFVLINTWFIKRLSDFPENSKM